MNASHRQSALVDSEFTAKYEILDELGGGGMGRVLRARHRQLKRMVAIKLLHQDLTSPESVTRFLREARAAAQIRSPHIAHVMDTGLLQDGQPYIVMEYLDGQNLARMVATRGRLPIEQAVGYMLQALDALAEAHSLQIIHRDIKPGNLFATSVAGGDIAIKVVDFGLAKTGGALDTLDPGVTERGAVLGTPSYMAPEQFVDAQDVDVRADIWAVGATLFELLTGVPPFRGTNLPQVYTAVMHQPIPLIRSVVPELPERLEQVVATCLTRERDRRYANVAELASALAVFADANARGRVDRIRRMIDGARLSVERSDLSREDLLYASPANALQVGVGVVSSTFTRPSGYAPATPIPETVRAPSRRKYVVGASVAVLALAGSALWLLGAKQVETPPPTTQAPPRAHVETPTPMLPPPTASTPAVATETTIAPPPPTVPVAHPTAKKARRGRTTQAPAPKPPLNAAIYQEYP